MSAPSLGMAVRGLLRRTLEVYQDSPEASGWLQHHVARFDEPLRLAIAGKVKAGKSTLLNALVGEQIAPTDAGECTRLVTWYRDGHRPEVTLFPQGAPPRQLRISREGQGALQIDLGGTPVETVDRLVVTWPSASLRSTTLIDTPGIGSLSIEASERTTGFLTPDESPTAADAVLYLMRHLHSSDVRFLESFHDQGVAKAAPINTIAVLSRADEIGVGRMNALTSARLIARRYRSDDKLRGLAQTVVAVAGLLAQTGRTLRQDEFLALSQLAKMPESEIESLLLSADRFVSPAGPAHPDAEVRSRLLDRFGIFGVRVSTTMLRESSLDPSALAKELVQRSGLDELREILATQFTERRDLLKARSALLAIDLVLRREPRPASASLAVDVERILAGAHEFAELRLLTDLRTRTVRFPPEIHDEAERLLGGAGGAPAARLGLDREADAAQLRAATLEALSRWQRRAENPMSGRTVADAARVVVRSCEGVLAGLPR